MSSTEEAPTLYPNKEEFANPIKYLNSKDVVKLGEEYGILKIKPPKNWRPPFSINEKNFKFHTRLQNLNELNLTNRSRQFWLNGFNNYLRMKGRKQIKNGFINLKNNNSKAFHLYDLYTGNNYHEYMDLFTDPLLFSNFIEYSIYLKKHLKNNKTQLDSKSANEPFDFDKFTSEINESYLKNNGNSKSNTGCEICKLKDDPSKILICDDCNQLYHMRCLNPPLKSIPKNDWFCDDCLEGSNGDYGFEEDFDSIFTLNEFRKDCEEFKTNYCNSRFNGNMNPSVNTLEKEFWKIVEQDESRSNEVENNLHLEVRYGADIHNEELDEISGFPMATNPSIDKEECKDYIYHPFNLTNLPFAEGSLLNYIKDESREQISGMTVPWLYVGSMFSTFCWHKEDHYTLSANYCHLGETKKWYGIPASQCDMFEYICHEISPDYFTKQPDLLHQLVSLLSPSKIYQLCKEKLNKKIKMYYVNQNPNEFVVTFPKVYHAGFNCGFNVNEAVNFTMPYWLNYGNDSINEYQLVKKENVFNHYKLLRNILDGFLIKKESDSLIGSESIFPADVISEMIKVAFTDYCSEIRKFKLILNDRNLLDFLKLINSKEYKDYLIEENEKKIDVQSDETVDERSVRKSTRMTSMRMKNNNSEEDSIDEFICNDCKSFVNFKWIEIDTLKELENEFHMNNNNNNGNNLNSSLLPTPNQSPVFAQEAEFRDAESEFLKIVEDAKSLKKDKSSIKNEQEDIYNFRKFNKRRRIEVINLVDGEDDQESINEEDQDKAEAQDKAEDNERTIRKSRRLAAKKSTTPVEIIDLSFDPSFDTSNDELIKEKKLKLLSSMRRKRVKNSKYGKVVLCLKCFNQKLENLNADDHDNQEKLINSSLLFNDYEVNDLENYICFSVQAKVLNLLH